jgi:hypothetical protein
MTTVFAYHRVAARQASVRRARHRSNHSIHRGRSACRALRIVSRNFVLEVVLTRGSERRRAISRGRDACAVTAPLTCEAVERLLKGQFRSAGAQAPGEIFDPKAVLAALGPDYPFEIVSS